MKQNRLQRTSNLLLEQLESLAKTNLRGEALREELDLRRAVNDTAKRIIEAEKADIDRIRIMNDAGLVIEGQVNRPSLEHKP